MVKVNILYFKIITVVPYSNIIYFSPFQNERGNKTNNSLQIELTNSLVLRVEGH